MKPKKKSKYQRTKLAAVPVLFCMLGYVLLSQTQPHEEFTAAQLADPQSAQSLPSQANAAATPASPLHWPEVDLQFLSQANPLASQCPSIQSNRTEHLVSLSGKDGTPRLPASDPLQSLAHDLTGSQINYVFKSNRCQAIMLGDQLFEQGELLSGTVQLHDIQDHALVLMEAHHAPVLSWSTRSLTELMARFSQLLRQNARTPSPEVGAMSEEPSSGLPGSPRVVD